MKVKCLNCGEEVDLIRLEHGENNLDGFHTNCIKCRASFDIDFNPSMTFITDVAKMADFKILTEEEFLSSYSYLTKDEYDATVLYFNWLNSDEVNHKMRCEKNMEVEEKQERLKNILYNAISLLINETFEQYDDSEEWFKMFQNKLGCTADELESFEIKITVDGGCTI